MVEPLLFFFIMAWPQIFISFQCLVSLFLQQSGFFRSLPGVGVFYVMCALLGMTNGLTWDWAMTTSCLCSNGRGTRLFTSSSIRLLRVEMDESN